MRACLVLTLTAAACSGGGDDPRQVLPVASDPDFALYVSNQSFDLDPVDIRVYLDDELAVEGDFLVEGQHSWHTFQFELGPGDHTLRAVTDAGDNQLIHAFGMGQTDRYGVLNFWYYPTGSPEPYGPLFSFDILDDPPQFD